MSTRPPRPSAQHWYDRENNRWLHPNELTRIREAALENDPDFIDIEAHGHSDLRGPRASVSLHTVQNEKGIRAGTGMSFNEVIADDDPCLQYHDGFAARYFRAADTLLSAMVREGTAGEHELFCLRCHAEGHSQLDTAHFAEDELGLKWTRRYIRDFVDPFAERVKQFVDSEAFAQTKVLWEDDDGN